MTITFLILTGTVAALHRLAQNEVREAVGEEGRKSSLTILNTISGMARAIGAQAMAFGSVFILLMQRCITVGIGEYDYTSSDVLWKRK